MKNFTNQVISEKSVDGILFDLGGVLIEIDFERIFIIWASYSKVSVESIKSQFTFDTHYERHERGEIGYLEYFESLRNSLGINLSDNQFIEGWNAIFGDEIVNITTLLSRLSQKRPLFLLTNTNTLHQRNWEKKYAKLLSYFQQIFVSSDIGLRKPELEVFNYISTTTGIDLNRFVFYDDTLENITGAINAGVRSIQVRSTADISESLKEILK